MAGRVSLDGSGDGSLGDPRRDRSLWTPELVEERLIGAVELWRRTPGGGTSPFAGDGPWELAFREAPGPGSAYSWDVIGDEAAARARRPLPLDQAEVAERDAASAMVLLAPERDRRLVVVTVAVKATGRRVRWSAIRAKLGGEISGRGLGMRYTRALAAMAKGLSRGPVWVGLDLSSRPDMTCEISVGRDGRATIVSNN